MSEPESRFGTFPVHASGSRLGVHAVPDPESRLGVYNVPTVLDPESRCRRYTTPTVPTPESRLGLYSAPDPEPKLGSYTVPGQDQRLGVHTVPRAESRLYTVPSSETRLGVYSVSDPESRLHTIPDPESRFGICTISDPESRLGFYTGTDSDFGAYTIPEPVIGEPRQEGSTATENLICFPIFGDAVQPFIAELFGTILFIFVDCSVRVANSKTEDIQPAVAAGLIWMALIMAFGQISEGHYNPALSLTVCLCGKMQMSLLVPYVVAQIVGAMIGAALVKALYPSEEYNATHGGAFDVVRDSNLLVMVVSEGILTLVLTTVVFMVTVNEKTCRQGSPIYVGVTLTATIFAGRALSGGCMNPARAFGPALSSGYWANHWIYWLGPTCGALLSACIIRLLFGDTKIQISLK